MGESCLRKHLQDNKSFVDTGFPALQKITAIIVL